MNEAKEVYTWFVATDDLRDAVSDDILSEAMRMLAQQNKVFAKALEQMAKGNIPNHISIGKTSSDNFALSFVHWLKSNGIVVADIEPLSGKSVFFLSGDADDPATSKSFEWAVFIYLLESRVAKEALAKIRSVPPPKPGVGEEIKKPLEEAQKSIWRIVVGAFLTFFGLAGICMMLSGDKTDAPICFGVPIMLVFGITLLRQGITGKGIPSKSETAQSPSKGIQSISKPARSPSQPEAEPSWVKPLAIASLVLSISALPASVVGCGLFFPIPAVIFGLISYTQAKKSNSPRNIRLMALVGTILGGLLILLLAILAVAALFSQNT